MGHRKYALVPKGATTTATWLSPFEVVSEKQEEDAEGQLVTTHYIIEDRDMNSSKVTAVESAGGTVYDTAVAIRGALGNLNE